MSLDEPHIQHLQLFILQNHLLYLNGDPEQLLMSRTPTTASPGYKGRHFEQARWRNLHFEQYIQEDLLCNPKVINYVDNQEYKCENNFMLQTGKTVG